nr:hypothetical protein HK105_001955 [Polyrhizophydium stewartii]
MARHLDLRRITNRVIASGLPWKQPSSGQSHRNNVNDLARFLDCRYHDRYMIWNLAGDTAQGSYPIEPFHNRVVAFPLSKAYHLSIRTLLDVCRSMHAWLSLHPANVAVVHCTNGVGRTGAAIASYLRFAEIIPDAKEAFEYFAFRRDCVDRSWASVSIERYVDYVNNVMNLGGAVPSPYPFRLHHVVLNGIPNFDGKGGCDPGIEIYESGKLVFSTNPASAHLASATSSGPDRINSGFGDPSIVRRTASSIIFRIPSTEPLFLEKDIQLRIFHTPAGANDAAAFSQSQLQSQSQSSLQQQRPVVTMVSFSFNSGFMPSRGIIRVAVSDLDIARRDTEERRFPKDFTMDVVISESVSQQQETLLEKSRTAGQLRLSYARSLDTSLLRCLSRLVCYHLVRINESHMRTLESRGINRVLACYVLQNMGNDLVRALELARQLCIEHHVLRAPTYARPGAPAAASSRDQPRQRLRGKPAGRDASQIDTASAVSSTSSANGAPLSAPVAGTAAAVLPRKISAGSNVSGSGPSLMSPLPETSETASLLTLGSDTYVSVDHLSVRHPSPLSPTLSTANRLSRETHTSTQPSAGSSSAAPSGIDYPPTPSSTQGASASSAATTATLQRAAASARRLEALLGQSSRRMDRKQATSSVSSSSALQADDVRSSIDSAATASSNAHAARAFSPTALSSDYDDREMSFDTLATSPPGSSTSFISSRPDSGFSRRPSIGAMSVQSTTASSAQPQPQQSPQQQQTQTQTQSQAQQSQTHSSVLRGSAAERLERLLSQDARRRANSAPTRTRDASLTRAERALIKRDL